MVLEVGQCALSDHGVEINHEQTQLYMNNARVN